MRSFNQLDLLDLNRLRWLTGNVLALSSLLAIRIMDVVGPGWLILMLGIVGWVTVRPSLVGRIPLWAVRFGAPVLVLLAVLDFVTSGRDFLPPMVRLIGLLTVLRAVQNRRQREDLQLAVLSLFLVVVSGVFTLSLQFAFQLAIFSPLAIGFLFLSNLMAAREAGQFLDCEWGAFRWRDFVPAIGRTLDWRGLGYASGLMVVFVAMAGTIFVAIPRFKWAQSIPFFQMEGQAQTGFSSTVSLGDVTEIAQDNRVAFRVDPGDGSAVPTLPYWRMMTLDRYEEGTFEHSDLAGEIRPPRRVEDNSIAVGDVLRFRGTREVIEAPWTFYFEGGISRYLPLVGPARNLRFQQQQEVEISPAFFTVALPEPLNTLLFFQIRGLYPVDRVPAADPDRRVLAELNGPIWIPPEDRMALRGTPYPKSTLALPVGGTDRLFLEERVAALFPEGVGDPEAAARRIAEDLQSRHSYSLSSLPVNDSGDPVVRWLESGAPGHCEYFAGGMILIARAAGIPARMAVGFVGGNWNSYENYFVVRNEHAHAWVEIFAGGQWIRIDPTPGNSRGAPGGGDALVGAGGAGFQIETGFAAWMDSLRVLWYRRVINFDETDQEAIAEQVSGFWEKTKAFLRELANEAVSTFRDLRSRLEGLPFYQGVLLLLLIGCGFLGVFILRGGRLMCRWFFRRLGEGSGRFPLIRDRREARILLDRMDALREEQPDRLPEEFDPVYREVQSVRFGPGAGTAAARGTLKRARRRQRQWRRRR